MDGILDAIREAAGDAPRRLNGWRSYRHRMTKPDWCISSDPLSGVFTDQDRLVRRGQIVWGAIVQANEILFSTRGLGGWLSAPAALIYSLDASSFADPMPLLQTADRLYATKGDQVEPELQVFADTLADELESLMHLPVPLGLSGHYPTVYTSIFVQRSHLPGRKLSDRLLPIYVLPEETTSTMIVPHWYWPKAFKTAWRG